MAASAGARAAKAPEEAQAAVADSVGLGTMATKAAACNIFAFR